MLSEIIKLVEEQSFNIADKTNNIATYERLINVVDEGGRYVEDSKDDGSNPVISNGPTLFLRKRNLGFTEFISKIIQDLEGKEDIVLPEFFENILGNYNESDNAEVVGDNWNQSGIDEDVLLTLPANNEQMRIIKYLDNYGAVLVQGPPGTGKTHTIANLIGHLLSRGDSVLVASHTEKALSVLKDKVYKELQSLCISLLSSSSERKEMDATLFEIAEKSTSLDKNVSLRKINNLEKQRKELVDLYKEKNAELLSVRSLEYKDLVYGNTTIRPIDAAKFINKGKDTLDLIPGITTDDTILLPLSLESLGYLYDSNELIDKEEESILHKILPSIDDIWDIEKLRKNMDGISKYENQLKDWVTELEFSNDVSKDILINLLDEIKRILKSIDEMDSTDKAIINKNIVDSMYKVFWEDIFRDYESLSLEYEEYRKITFYNSYTIPEELYCEETIITLNDIISSGKDVPVNLITGIVKPKWKKIRESVTNNRKPLDRIQEYKEVKYIISYILRKEEIINRINKLNFELDMEEKIESSEHEEKIGKLLNKVKSSLNWYKGNWINYTNKLENIILNIDDYHSRIKINLDNGIKCIKDLSIDYLEHNINNYYCNLLLNELMDDRRYYLELLNKYLHYGNPFDELSVAVKENYIIEYTSNYNRLLEIYSKNEVSIRRNSILEELKIYAPEWSKMIKNREGIHGIKDLPENIGLAWKWRQLSNQIDRINSCDPNIIQKELEKLNKDLMKNAKELAYEKAWYKKVMNNTAEQTQAIEGWRQTMRQIGKGTGKTAPMLREKARQLMPLCQTSIPVWIMPLNRVAENFDPERNKFDVIIIDEASQADILALSTLYLGKKIIIVGDDEQVSPEAVGIKVDEITALIDQHLVELPNSHLFNGRTSIYDIAKTSGFKPIMLVEHFRCLPEIIEFSNQLSYNGRIKPLRDTSGVNIKPSVIEYRVPKGYRNDNKLNFIEAEHIASLICACIENENYKNKTIGVISLLGQEQAYEIDRILQRNLEPKEYEDRKIQCGTSAQFQGDERDIIFLSVVDGPKEGGGPLRLLSQDGNNDINRKRYNVAASRAKDQMWVVHSLNPEIDLKPDDLRLRLIKYSINPKIDLNEETLKNTESDFEFKVMKNLLNKGYKVYPQWQVGAYRIDMVVEYKDKRIALECDGERWHTQDDLADDLKRQAILERLGWTFIRVRGSAFYRDPEKAMEIIYRELEENNIKPDFSIDDQANELKDNELINSIKRRSEGLRREWNGTIDEVDMEGENKIEESNLSVESSNLEDSKFVVKEKSKIKNNDKEDLMLENRTIINNSSRIKVNITNTKTEKEQREERIKGDKVTSIPIFDFRKR